METERAAIGRRRDHIRRLPEAADAGDKIRRRDRTGNELTGVALSGGGIRSASVSLGALQGLEVSLGIEGVDYPSTVSGGGYTGCSLTNTMQDTSGVFPLPNLTL